MPELSRRRHFILVILQRSNNQTHIPHKAEQFAELKKCVRGRDSWRYSDCDVRTDGCLIKLQRCEQQKGTYLYCKHEKHNGESGPLEVDDR